MGREAEDGSLFERTVPESQSMTSTSMPTGVRGPWTEVGKAQLEQLHTPDCIHVAGAAQNIDGQHPNFPSQVERCRSPDSSQTYRQRHSADADVRQAGCQNTNQVYACPCSRPRYNERLEATGARCQRGLGQQGSLSEAIRHQRERQTWNKDEARVLWIPISVCFLLNVSLSSGFCFQSTHACSPVTGPLTRWPEAARIRKARDTAFKDRGRLCEGGQTTHQSRQAGGKWGRMGLVAVRAL